MSSTDRYLPNRFLLRTDHSKDRKGQDYPSAYLRKLQLDLLLQVSAAFEVLCMVPHASMLSCVHKVIYLLVLSLDSGRHPRSLKVDVAWRLPSHLEGSGLPALVQASN